MPQAVRTRQDFKPADFDRTGFVRDLDGAVAALPAAMAFGRELARLRTLIDTDLRRLQDAMHAAGAPWTPGALPEWKGK